MINRSKPRSGAATTAALAAVAALFLLGAFASSAFAAPPKNTSLPTISPSTPEVGKAATATTGTWASEVPAHWLEETTPLKEGEKVGVTPNGTMIHYAGMLGGAYGEIDCWTTMTGASLENPSGGGSGVGNVEIKYENCVAAYEWSKCEVTPGAAVPVKIELTTVEGKVKLSPTGANLGSFTLSGKECLIGGVVIKVVGTIEGRFSNAHPRIEFNPETSLTGALRLQSKSGPKASATGAIGFETGAGNDIKTDALAYSYAWKRCTGESCTEIGGATSSAYTPTAEDWGKTLKVTVTATDANGSTPATSAATSAVKGTPNWYANNSGWQHLTSSPFTSSNILEGGGQAYKINWTWGGIWFEINCSGGSGEGTMTNTATQAKLEGYKLTLSSCFMSGPGSCQLTSSTLAFNTLTATSATGPTSTPSTKLTFAPSGTDVVSFSFENCGGLTGPYKFVGSFPGTFVNSGSYVSHPFEEVKSAGTLKFQSSTGPVVSFEGVQRLLSEAHPVKLDAGS